MESVYGFGVIPILIVTGQLRKIAMHYARWLVGPQEFRPHSNPYPPASENPYWQQIAARFELLRGRGKRHAPHRQST
jgi:hypothetical protein